MRRASVVAIAAAISLAASALFAAPAGAQTQPATTVTPSTDLVDGQPVQVESSGWGPSTVVQMGQCAVEEPLLLTCVPPVQLTADDLGAISTTVTVQRFVQDKDCAVTPPQCVLILLGPLGDVTVTLLTFRSVPEVAPDLVIKRRSDGMLFFDNVYEPASLWSHTTVPGGFWTYAILVQNDGITTGDLVVNEASFAGSPSVSVQYFYGYYDVTAAVRGSGLAFPSMTPGESRLFAVRFHAEPEIQNASGRVVLRARPSPDIQEARDSLMLGVTVP